MRRCYSESIADNPAAEADNINPIEADLPALAGYASIDDRIVWDLIQDDLPGLQATLNRLLRTGP